jgi:hypothetical protein
LRLQERLTMVLLLHLWSHLLLLLCSCCCQTLAE